MNKGTMVLSLTLTGESVKYQLTTKSCQFAATEVFRDDLFLKFFWAEQVEAWGVVADKCDNIFPSFGFHLSHESIEFFRERFVSVLSTVILIFFGGKTSCEILDSSMAAWLSG
jgi:hypothetical protein